MNKQSVRIGAGCSVDITLALPQMVQQGNVGYIVIDYMTEVAVAGMAADRLADPHGGYGRDLVGPELRAEMSQMLASGIKLVTNAGGLNPKACARAIEELAASLGLKPKIAIVEGDDVLERLRGENNNYRDMFDGTKLRDNLVSANAYLGAAPIAAALAKGADIVITGRVVDSALIMGPLIHEFGWSMDDYDRLAGGTLIGHLLECGPQPSGGIYTDWREIDWANMSFPIAECFPDGTAIMEKVTGTGGQISIGTISEQILYEIGDPQRYFMPEVTCDLSNVVLEALDTDRVRVSGAKGYAPTGNYKVCAMSMDGWRTTVAGVTTGPDATEKARRSADAILERCDNLFRARNLGEIKNAGVQLIGTGESAGPRVASRAVDLHEAVYRVVIDHDEKDAADLALRVSKSALVSMAPGTAGSLGASVTPIMRMNSILMDAATLPADVSVGTVQTVVQPNLPAHPFSDADVTANAAMPLANGDEDGVEVPIVKLAWLRSGDKGDKSNIGVIARDPTYVPYLNRALTERSVGDWFAHILTNPEDPKIKRYELPGLNAFNLLLDEALDGGAVASRRFDIMGKGLGQQMAEFPVRVPAELAARLG